MKTVSVSCAYRVPGYKAEMRCTPVSFPLEKVTLCRFLHAASFPVSHRVLPLTEESSSRSLDFTKWNLEQSKWSTNATPAKGLAGGVGRNSSNYCIAPASRSHLGLSALLYMHQKLHLILAHRGCVLKNERSDCKREDRLVRSWRQERPVCPTALVTWLQTGLLGPDWT